MMPPDQEESLPSHLQSGAAWLLWFASRRKWGCGGTDSVDSSLASAVRLDGQCPGTQTRHLRRGGSTALGLFAAAVACGANAAGIDCLIEANQIAELASPVSGLVETVAVRRGDVVRKGQVLAQLHAQAEQAAADLAKYKSEQLGPIQLAEGKLEFSRRKFERRKEMASEKLMSPQERDDAEAEFKLADAELVVARDNRQLARIEHRQQSALLGHRTIRSPFDGVVVDQLAYAGEVVEPGSSKTALLKVAQLNPLRVHVILPKEVFGKVAVGTAVDLTAELPAGARYTAKVRSVDRLIDAASGTFVAFLELPNPKLDIPAGVKCQALIPGAEAATRRERR